MANLNFPVLDLDKILSQAQLPALPQSAIRLLELSQDPKNGPPEFALAIETDPGLAGQVLRFVNSSYFGFAKEISSVRLAITLVGIRTIKNFVLWSAVFSLMPNPKCGPFELKNLWQDSLRRALFARSVGRLLGMSDADELFSAGLLQDMAVPVLAKEAPEAYAKLLEARQRGPVRLSELEQHLFGWTHARAGCILARHWNLPDSIADLIDNHLEIDRLVEDPTAAPCEMAVASSALLPSTRDRRWNECPRLEKCYQQATGGQAPALGELLAQIDAEFAEFAPLLKVSTAVKTLGEAYQEVTAAAG
ncbi:MAG TPA: HDOD domain-containing protein [Planctomycetaceae bacterium]|nr:HDOD domain-containing protein [Planctomycetaceae bacterium]HIQ19893.1 HDOD domain-containing protein [Planctomycetota bacterium]